MLKKSFLTGLSGLFFLPVAQAEIEFSGYVEGEVHIYQQTGLFEEQKSNLFSVAAEPELYWESEDESQSVRFKAFGRYSDPDGNRDHGDIRELYYSYAGSGWQMEVGINKVFWGVTEAAHLVDIINQTDNVESITGEEKLGQPMISFGLEQSWGNLDMYVLPVFRERKFPKGPERFVLSAGDRLAEVVESETEFESDDEENNIDYAIRWAQSFDDVDLALSYFDGTNRDPLPVILNAVEAFLDPEVTPLVASHYEQITQTGIEVQYLYEDWAFKLEGFHRQANTGDYSAAVAGFEYTLTDLEPWGQDIGILVEYLWNDRDDFDWKGQTLSGEALSPLEDDLFVGARFTMNDAASTDFIAGVIRDLSDGTMSGKFEGGTRVGDDIRLTLNVYFYSNVDQESALYAFRKDDQIEFKVAKYF